MIDLIRSICEHASSTMKLQVNLIVTGLASQLTLPNRVVIGLCCWSCIVPSQGHPGIGAWLDSLLDSV